MINKIREVYEKANYTKKSNRFKDFVDTLLLTFLMVSIGVNLALFSELIKRLDIIIKNLPNQ